MARRVEIPESVTLGDYSAVAHLAPAVHEVQVEASRITPRLQGRRLWMINSTAQGGGVAEMLPTMVSLLRELGIDTEWVVIESEEEAFFQLTKQLHNMIHGESAPEIRPGQREVYESVNRRNAEALSRMMAPDDILIVHDPQPLPLAGILRAEHDRLSLWRCHIGLDETNPATRAAWDFLAPYLGDYQHSVFSAPEYIPEILARRATVIYPAINPLTAKNRELHLHTTVGILSNAGLAVSPGPVVRAPFPQLAERLQRDGSFAPAVWPEDLGLLIRPIVTQVSRWDRLKGWIPLMKAFAKLKTEVLARNGEVDPIHRRRLELVRLMLAGPDPASIQDDPEGQEVLEELKRTYLAMDHRTQSDVALIALPMYDRRQNALMVNALQRSSSLVVQNSIREGFGLTVTEAMWKRIPVLTNAKACGPRQQVRDGIDGRLIEDPEDLDELVAALDAMLEDTDGRSAWGRNGQRHVHEKFLIFSQLRSWLQLLSTML